MAREYSVEVCKELEGRFRDAGLHRPMRIARYEAATELSYEVVGLEPADKARVRLVVEEFVGGGFAGQVYKVKLLQMQAHNRPIEGLQAGRIYAIKILIPPAGFSRFFRDLLYRAGFQGPFQPQVNPTAARVGALWQKFIRRGAKIRLGDERAVADIYATLVDEKLGSCGELSEWVEGRTWRLEVDEHVDLLRRWGRGKAVDPARLGSPEYRAKRQFMRDLVKLLHDMGAYEVARQYEWSTCKSQPNCLKRWQSEDDPGGGLVAVDFRAGLTLLPFLPMSPGDFKLIIQGMMRGSLVQFDRGDVGKLEGFVRSHGDEFADMSGMLGELKAAEQAYRDSVPDITHHHIRLLYSGRLWSTILDSSITGWRVRNLLDNQHEQKLRNHRFLTLLFCLTGVIPFGGTFLRRLWAREDWRKHYHAILTSKDYFKQAIQARFAEKVIVWHRTGRMAGKQALKTSQNIWRFLCHWPLSILPAGLHRLLTDREFRREKLVYIFVRPVKLYFKAPLRERWLRETVTEGQKKHILSDEDAEIILSQVNEPFIQKYLKSLAVHICTLPVTQVVSVLVAIIYVLTHPEMPRAQAWAIGLGIIALFQVVPVSPGSLVRGLYVLYLVIRERNFKDYNIAVFLGFFKYIGYLAFPIQMTYRYPALARFMAAHWATNVVHIVPVFGERGALLEHWVFCLFYNWPLTIRSRMRRRAEIRASMKPRYWHIGVCVVAAILIFVVADLSYLRVVGSLPGLKDMWWLAILVPLFCGAVVTLGGGGAVLWKRLIGAGICGILTGLVYTAILVIMGHIYHIRVGRIAKFCGLWIFSFAILSALGAIFTELKLPNGTRGS